MSAALDRRISTALGRVGRTIVVLAVPLVFAFPVYWLVIGAFGGRGREGAFLPRHWGGDSFAAALELRGPTLVNSIIVSGATTALAVGLGTMCGYAFARYFPRVHRLPFWILAVRMLPPVALAPPLFLAANALDVMDTLFAVGAAHLVLTLPFAVWMMRAFFLEIPAAVCEAAVIDGCSQWQLFRLVALPLARPGLAVTAVFCFVFSWNEYLLSLVLTRRDAMPVTVALNTIGGEAHAALAILAILPVVLLTVLAQRHLVRGLTLGAVK